MKVWAAQKFGLLLGVFLILTGLTFWDNGLKDIYARYGGARVSFYLTADEDFSLKAYSGGVLIIKNGSGVIVEAPSEAALEMRRDFSNIKGESVSFEGGAAAASEILGFYRARTVFEETVSLGAGDSIKVIYAFSRQLTRSVNLDGKKVNIQIAINSASGRVTAGTPLILGSY